jgi:hypothetical protein
LHTALSQDRINPIASSPVKDFLRSSPLPLRILLFFSLFSILLGGCATFERRPPPLLLSQTPKTRPIFVSHPPKNTGETAYYSGHAKKAQSLKDARTKALNQALEEFASTLEKKGYALTDLEKTRSLTRDFGSPGSPRIAGTWVRVYKESSDRPYLHKTSVYLLVAIPESFTRRIIRELIEKDRFHQSRGESEERLARGALARSDGASFLLHLQRARDEYRKIHSLRSFPPANRPVIHKRQIMIDALWRKTLRDVDLSLSSSLQPFYLTNEGKNLPLILERARLIREKNKRTIHPVGLSGLSLHLSLYPETVPDPLVFPPLSWLFRNDRPVLSRSLLNWEIHLFRSPVAHDLPFFQYRCDPTDGRGEGRCFIFTAWVPGTTGYIEGFYQPLPGTRLDSEYFRTLLARTLMEEHFVFYRKRLLHPILLSLRNLSSDRKGSVRKSLVDHFTPLGFNLCRRSGNEETLDCSRALPSGIAAPSQPVLRILVEKERLRTRTHGTLALSESRVEVREALSDGQGVFWTKRAGVRSLGFSPEEARHFAWEEIGRRLARDLDLFYFRKQGLLTGEEFYER